MVPTEHKSGTAQNEDIQAHDKFPYREGKPFGEKDCDDFGAVKRAAHPDNQADAHAENNTAKYGCQKRING
ncbi:hypothetical protein D3C71_2169400 [compost metagenome]